MGSASWLEVAGYLAFIAILLYCVFSIIFKIAKKEFKK